MLKLVFLLLIVLGVAGYFLGWFQFEKTKTVDGDTKYSVTVDKDKVKDSVHKAGEKAKDLATKVGEIAGVVKTEGKIVGVNPLTGSLKVDNGSEVVEARVTGETELLNADGGKLSGVADLVGLVNGRCTVHYAEKDGKKVATKVVVAKK